VNTSDGSGNRRGNTSYSGSTDDCDSSSNSCPIYVDASQPATLRYEGHSVACHTLEEAVSAWMRLPDDEREQATIRVNDGTIYNAKEIGRLYSAPGTQHG
jgi:hypothetical protein